MFLRRVHDLLSCLLSTDGRSSSPPVEDRASDCAASMLISNWLFKTRIIFTEITDLSNTLFDQLEEYFELLFSDKGRPALTDSYQEELILLLRCCIVMLQFLEFDLSLVVDKCNILLSIFRRLFVPNLTFPHCSCKVGAGLNDVARGVADLIPLRCPNILVGTSEMNEETRRLMLSFFCRVLEVFMEEILMNCQIRKHFTMTDNVSSTTQKLFVSHGSYGDIYAIQEIISSHFLLSANDEWTFQRFINLLFGGEVEDVSELSLSTVLSLLGTRSMYFMPCMLEAHLMLLASKCIHMQRPDYDDEISCDEMMNFHLEAFELSVNVYVDYSTRLKFVDDTNGGSAQICLPSKKLHFDSCIQPMTCNRLQHQMDCLADFCRFNSQGILSESKEDIAKKSFAYIKANCHVFDDMWQDEADLILKYIILNILSEENGKYMKSSNDNEIELDIYCFAAVVKLMSSSLLQIIRNLRQKGHVGASKKVEDKSAYREYNHISDIISCFGKYDTDLFVKRILLDVIGANPAKHGSIQMFAHFVSLLCFSFRRRIGFLWNNCITVMMTILRLLIFEEGTLDVFTSLVVKSKEMFGLRYGGKTSRVLDHRRSSYLVASNLQRIQMLYLREDPVCLVKDQYRKIQGKEQEGHSTSTTLLKDSGEADNCSLENFIKCLPGYEKNISESDDLVDFIECKPGKDYLGWLRNRRRFRKWLHEKRYVTTGSNLNKEVGSVRKLRSKKSKYTIFFHL